jgi:hypothetical protein
MALDFATYAALSRVPYFGRPCPSCWEILLGPEAAEYVGARQIRHTWSCDACGHKFESVIEVRGGSARAAA